MINHHIQKYILSVLAKTDFARFRDMRPKNVDSNLYSYHLKLLMKQGMIAKTDDGYCLTAKGLAYVDRVNMEKFAVRLQPKILTMILLKNKYNEILLTKRNKQPFINTWTLPSGKLHLDDERIAVAAERELFEKTNLTVNNLDHIGDCYLSVRSNETMISSVLAHVFAKTVENFAAFGNENAKWTGETWRNNHNLTPGVEDILWLAGHSDGKFFAELDYKIDLG